MSSLTRLSSPTLQRLGPVFTLLRRQVAALDANLLIFDAAGREVGEFEPGCPLCEITGRHEPICMREIARLAGRVLRQGESCHQEFAVGCCGVGIPVHRRRRLIGAAVMCFPPREILQEERFARFCDSMHLDRQAARAVAETTCRHGVNECGDLENLLTWMLDREQEHQNAEHELTQLSNNLASTYEELSLLYRISGSMRVTQAPKDFLAEVCAELLEVMNISAVAAVLCDHEDQTDQAMVRAGELDMTDEQLCSLTDRLLCPRFEKGAREVLSNAFRDPDAPDASAVRSLVAVPLGDDQSTMGVLVGFNKTGGEFDSPDLKLINSIANQAGIFLTNNKLYADLQDLLMGVLNALTESIDAKDPYTRGHSQRVALISRRIAERLDLPATEIQQVYLAGLLHDVGKIGVPEAVLRKEGRLTDEEYESIKRHPSVGAKILGGIKHLEDVLGGILCHHERPDGTGYPEGLAGDDIPLSGRIVGLADAFDAMTSHRTYRRALTPETAVAEIRKHAGKQFDPHVVETFLQIDLDEFIAELQACDQEMLTISLSAEHH